MSLGEPPGGTSVRGGGGGLVAAAAAAAAASPAPAPPPPPRDFAGDFAGDLLRAHNAARARHGAAPLRACAALEREARAWAEHLLERRALKHSDTSHGENLYYRPLGAREQGAEPGGKEVTEHWYSEVKHYDFSSPGYKPNTVHFTQLVWRASCMLGVGRACDGRRLIVVTLYSPPGNQGPQGAFHDNVLPPCPMPPPLPALPPLPVPPTCADASPCPVLPTRTPPPSSSDASKAKAAGSDGPQASDFQKDLLVAHNALRKRHGAKPLVLSAELCAGAQLRAEALLLLLMEPGAVTMPRGGQPRENRSHEHPAHVHTEELQPGQRLHLGEAHADRLQVDEAQPGSLTEAELAAGKRQSEEVQAETSQLEKGKQDNVQPDNGHVGSSQVDKGPCDDTRSRTRREDEPPRGDSQGKPSQPASPNHHGLKPANPQPQALQPDKLQSSDIHPGRIWTERLQEHQLHRNKVMQEGLPPSELQPDKLSPDKLETEERQPYQLQPEALQPTGMQSNKIQSDQIRSNEACELKSSAPQPAEAQAGGVEAMEAGRAGERLPGAARWDAADLERVGRRESRPGENVYLGVGGDATHPTASEVTDAWYSEIVRHNFDILSPQTESAPNGSCVPGTEGVDEDRGPRVTELAGDDDCALEVDAGVMLTPEEAVPMDDTSSVGGGSGIGKSEKSSLVEGVRESDAMEDPDRSVAESTATVMDESASTRAVGTGGKTDALSELAPKEAMPKSVSFLSLGDAPWTMELSMQSADTDLDTEESSGTETLVMDSDRTTCEIMDKSEAEATEELPWVAERVHGGAGSCEEVGREDTLAMEKIIGESRTKEHTRGGDEGEMVAGKDIRQAAEEVLNVAGGGSVEPSDGGAESEKTKRPRSDVENGTPGMMAAVTVAEVTCRRATGAVPHREVGVKALGGAIATKSGAAAGDVKLAPPQRDEAPKALARAGRRADCSAPGAPTVASGSKVTARTPRAEVVLSNVVGTEALIKATLVGDALSELYRRNVLPVVRSTPCTPQPHARLHISEEDQEEFCIDVLAEHNRLREIHGARPLRRSVALGRDARAWARELARSRALRSHPTVPHGQNVWAKHIGTGELPKGRKVTNCWYADRLAYDYNNPGFQQGTGNFSQLVWRSSLDLGVGLACDGRGMFVAVAFYSPAGNLPYAMSYRDNVLPPHTQGMAKGQG
ncbi:uncharacterized protein LOC116954712 isoform X2 [Petromyzon marinus]|uniref:uncharacterized protein LOC116954712 isoform X2 n=1 Tax=Petromyzon marinus TaxID=7757 RepID=UPI003F70B4CA